MAAVAANTFWNMKCTVPGMVESSPSINNAGVPMMPAISSPNMMLYPIRKNPNDPSTKSIRFFMMMFAAFLARVNPVSTIANPACMKNTNTVPSKVHNVSTDENINYSSFCFSIVLVYRNNFNVAISFLLLMSQNVTKLPNQHLQAFECEIGESFNA
ncbi:hypothetical protein SDC9_113978 [bioreactor metagenome]|uniref:Uncharacterized protein n=1 Tax=bioreactor metagenome TaxID=1076179 RepID=A0A645BPC7_9ZZZZ